jgi:hypothetical protein
MIASAAISAAALISGSSGEAILTAGKFKFSLSLCLGVNKFY